MSVRSDDDVESPYSIIFLTSGSCENFPFMAFTAICHFDFNILMIKSDHVSDLARIISQILQHGLSPREQLCPFGNGVSENCISICGRLLSRPSSMGVLSSGKLAVTTPMAFGAEELDRLPLTGLCVLGGSGV